MKGIYLAAGRAKHNGYDIVYQDLMEKRDIGGDMLEVDLKPYDFIIASPPCNYWSRCNYRRDTSKYAQCTKHLLPSILKKLCELDKPFIVENVRNEKMFIENGLYDLPCFIFCVGRHTYWTNVFMAQGGYEQHYDFKRDSKGHCVRLFGYVQGGYNVEQVINGFLEAIH